MTTEAISLDQARERQQADQLNALVWRVVNTLVADINPGRLRDAAGILADIADGMEALKAKGDLQSADQVLIKHLNDADTP